MALLETQWRRTEAKISVRFGRTVRKVDSRAGNLFLLQTDGHCWAQGDECELTDQGSFSAQPFSRPRHRGGKILSSRDRRHSEASFLYSSFHTWSASFHA